MAVGRVKHISPCLVGLPVGRQHPNKNAVCLDRQFALQRTHTVSLQTGEEPSLGVAMHIIETLVLDDAWRRTDTFSPESKMHVL